MSTNTDRQTPFIPPELYSRFTDLSKHCYNKRQENPGLKTLIKLGDEDLVLYTKHIGDKEWKPIDIHSIGDISSPEWHRLWPKQQLPEINSPPQGRRQSTKRDRIDDSSRPTQTHHPMIILKKQKMGSPTPTPIPTQNTEHITQNEGTAPGEHQTQKQHITQVNHQAQKDPTIHKEQPRDGTDNKHKEGHLKAEGWGYFAAWKGGKKDTAAQAP